MDDFSFQFFELFVENIVFDCFVFGSVGDQCFDDFCFGCIYCVFMVGFGGDFVGCGQIVGCNCFDFVEQVGMVWFGEVMWFFCGGFCQFNDCVDDGLEVFVVEYDCVEYGVFVQFFGF